MADAKKEAVLAVWKAWVATRPRPGSCILTAERRKLIRARLDLGYEAEHLVAVVRFMNESNDGLARWMRGDNPRRRAYLDLQNLFRIGKLGEYVERALNWLEDGPDEELAPHTGIDTGPLGAFGRGGTAEA